MLLGKDERHKAGCCPEHPMQTNKGYHRPFAAWQFLNQKSYTNLCYVDQRGKCQHKSNLAGTRPQIQQESS
ncbi:hypothetical protein D3C81_1826840 [compost metagenome]